jgi:aromatic ring-cleaving dioxygenase
MKIQSYHFHLYYPVAEISKAQSIVDKLKTIEGIEIGRVWDRPVGPHPIGSCQITVYPGDFEKMTNWFLENREGFDVFVHGVSGDDIIDHTKHVMWIGKEHPLKLEIFGI